MASFLVSTKSAISSTETDDTISPLPPADDALSNALPSPPLFTPSFLESLSESSGSGGSGGASGSDGASGSGGSGSGGAAPASNTASGSGGTTTNVTSAATPLQNITITTNNITGLPQGYQNCITAVIDFIQDFFHPEHSVTISVDFETEQKGTGVGGYFLNNDGNYIDQTSYAALTAALPSTDYVPKSDPGGAGSNWYVPSAYGRALGLSNFTPPSGSYDVTIKLNTSYTTWNYGQDVIAGLLHELSESALGRMDSLGGSIYLLSANQVAFQDSNGNYPSGATKYTNTWSTMDLFRYGGPGDYHDSDNQTEKTYFSSDDGNTIDTNYQLNDKNGPRSLGDDPGVDDMDWIGSGYGGTGKVFGGVAPGSALTLSPTEISVMQALGYTPQVSQDAMVVTGSWQDPTTWNAKYMPLSSTEDAYIGGGANVVDATLGGSAHLDDVVEINSIGTQAGDTLEIQNYWTLDALNGTVVNSADVGATLSGNAGTINVDAGGGLEFGGRFVNSGVISVSAANSSSIYWGALILNGPNVATLSGGGHVHLGVSATATSPGYARITGSGLINVDNAIDGGGSLILNTFDNQTAGTLTASASSDTYLEIDAPTISNEGSIDVVANARLALGNFGPTSFDNSGAINLGWDGIYSGEGAQLELDGTVTLEGAGTLTVRGSAAEIVSDDLGSDTFVNDSRISVLASAQIGDNGILGSAFDNNYSSDPNGLTFVNHGAVVASGSGVTLKLDTGTTTIDDGGGTLEADAGATLVINSQVSTGQNYVQGIDPTPPGGQIVANGGVVQIDGAVTAGPNIGIAQVSGQVVDVSGEIDIEAGGSVAVPITISGGGVVKQLAGAALTGLVTLDGPGATLTLNAAPATPNLVNASGSFGLVNLTASQVALSGGDNLVNFVAGAGDSATLSGTGGAWDTVEGSGGAVVLDSAQVSIVGGANLVTLNGAIDNVASLWSTGGAWDTAYAASESIILNKAQASIVGGGDYVTLDASGDDQASLWYTGGAWDTVTGSDGVVILNNAQASIVGGYDYVTFDASGDDQASLWNTGGDWDTVTGSNGGVVLNHAQASVVGGADRITLDGDSADQLSLWNTGGAWDTVTGANATVILNHAQASVVGAGDSITLDGDAADAVSLYNANAAPDTVHAVGGSVTLNSSKAYVIGYNDYIHLSGTNSVNETLTSQGGSFAYVFGAAIGIDGITNFQAHDTLQLSKSDFSSVQSLFANNVSHANGATIIKLDANDQIVLYGVTNLSQAQVSLV